MAVRTNCEATGVALAPGGGGAGHVLCAGGARVPFDECVWCTAAALAPWAKESTGLAIGARGFLAVNATLESTNTPGVFACGDCAGVVPYPRPKAGVFAVRQGPPLLANLRHALLGEPLEEYEPQEPVWKRSPNAPRTWMNAACMSQLYVLYGMGDLTVA